MSNLPDNMLTGHLSRRRLMMGVAVPLAGAAVAQEPAVAQQKDPKKKPGVVYSPENIGGGGRVERNFYRDWTKTSKVPMVEGYSILDAATQEVQPWPEIGGRGMYVNFSPDTHIASGTTEVTDYALSLPPPK